MRNSNFETKHFNSYNTSTRNNIPENDLYNNSSENNSYNTKSYNTKYNANDNKNNSLITNSPEINFQLTGYDSEYEIPEKAEKIYENKKLKFDIRKYNNTYYLVCNDKGQAIQQVYNNTMSRKNDIKYISKIMEITKEKINQNLKQPAQNNLNINRFIISCHGCDEGKFHFNNNQSFLINEVLQELANDQYFANTKFVMATACHAGKDLTTKTNNLALNKYNQTPIQQKQATVKSHNIIKALKNAKAKLLIVGNRHVNYNTPISILNTILDNSKPLTEGLYKLIKDTPSSMHTFANDEVKKHKNFKIFQSNKQYKQEKFKTLSKQEKAQYIITRIKKHIQNRCNQISSTLGPFEKNNAAKLNLSNREILQYITNEILYFNTKTNKSLQKSHANDHIKFILENPKAIIKELKKTQSINLNSAYIPTILPILKHCIENKIPIQDIKQHVKPPIAEQIEFLTNNINTLSKKYDLKHSNSNSIISNNITNWIQPQSMYTTRLNKYDQQIAKNIAKYNQIINKLVDIKKKLPNISELQTTLTQQTISKYDIKNLNTKITQTLLPNINQIKNTSLNPQDTLSVLQAKYTKYGEEITEKTESYELIQTKEEAFHTLQYLANKNIIKYINNNFDYNGNKLENNRKNDLPITDIDTSQQIINKIQYPQGPNGPKYRIPGIQHFQFTPQKLKEKLGIAANFHIQYQKPEKPYISTYSSTKPLIQDLKKRYSTQSTTSQTYKKPSQIAGRYEAPYPYNIQANKASNHTPSASASTSTSTLANTYSNNSLDILYSQNSQNQQDKKRGTNEKNKKNDSNGSTIFSRISTTFDNIKKQTNAFWGKISSAFTSFWNQKPQKETHSHIPTTFDQGSPNEQSQFYTKPQQSEKTITSATFQSNKKPNFANKIKNLNTPLKALSQTKAKAIEKYNKYRAPLQYDKIHQSKYTSKSNYNSTKYDPLREINNNLQKHKKNTTNNRLQLKPSQDISKSNSSNQTSWSNFSSKKIHTKSTKFQNHSNNKSRKYPSQLYINITKNNRPSSNSR